MKKRFLTLILTLTTMLMCILGLSACNKVEFKVNFMVDGAVYATVNTNGEETIKMPDDPVKEDYIFDGWYWDENTWQEPFTANSLLNAPLSSNMSVYAKFTEESDVKGTDIRMNGYTFTDDESLGKVYYISLPNNKIIYALYEDVTVHNKSTWMLSTDVSGNNTIASKTVELSVGNNVYYILVTDKADNVKQYIILVRRRPIYTVSFDTNGGGYCEPQSVEEGSLATAPEIPTKTGYTFTEWDWDFNAPILMNTTISASWTANKYSIHYDANGGTVSKAEQSVEYNQNYTLSTPTRNGYTFNGWYKGNEKVADGKWTFVEDWYLTAQWTANSNAITYNLDGGKNHTSNPSSYKTGTTVTLGKPTKTGYTFVGWTTDEITTPTQEMSILAEDYGAKTFTAHWTKNDYTVTYNANNGTASKENDTATYDSEFTLATAERKGYTFVGWYNGKTKVVDGAWKIADNVTLVAEWTINKYPITYVLNGGTATNENSYTVETEAFSLNEPTKTGYTFDGWTYDGQDTPVKTVTIEKGSIGDKSFTAHWTANDYTVTYNANGGTASKETDTATYDSEFTLATAERKGYTFVGWYNGNAKVANGTWNIANDATLTAKWTANTYKISYDVNGGTLSSTQQSVTYDKAYTLKTPTRIGYTFLYWAYNGEEFTNGTWNLTNSVTLLAEWKANEYTVTYNANGGECDMTSDTVTYDATCTVPIPTRVGYTFDGWYSGSTEYFGGTWRTANNVTLTAKWIAHTNIPYTVNHYLQNIEDDDYTFDSTQDFTGTSDDYVTPAVNTYTGFTSPTAQTVKVNPDGSRVVDYYYTRNYYTISFVANGGEYVKDITQKYGSKIELPTTTKEGFTFSNWYCDVDLTVPFDGIIPIKNQTVYAWWSEETKPNEFSYIVGTEITITKYNGENQEIRIPSYIAGTIVTTIADNAFKGNTNIQSVQLNDNITKIGSYAFYGCERLQEVGKTDNLIQVGDYAFSNCVGLTNMYLPNILSDNIGNYTFENCGLNKTINGVIYLSNWVTGIEDRTIPEIELLENTTMVCNAAFAACTTLERVTLGNSIKKIEESAFAGCSNLAEIILPAQLETIESYAFSKCEKLSNIGIACGASYIGEYAFNGCTSLDEVSFFNVIEIGAYAFNNCTALVKVLMPQINIIGEYAFYGCNSLTSFSFPDTMSEIGAYAFAKCSKLEKVTIPYGIIEIKEYTFSECSSAFDYIEIPGTVKLIQAYAFEGCASVKNIVIPKTVEGIAAYAFYKCDGLEEITIPYIGGGVLNDTDTMHTGKTGYWTLFGTIFGVKHTHGHWNYRDNDVWRETAGVNYGPNNNDYWYCYIPLSLKKVILNTSIIPARAFENCNNITEVVFNETITSIGARAFLNCSSITSFDFSKFAIEKLPDFFLTGSSSLNIVLPTTIISISEYAFSSFKGTIFINETSVPSTWATNWNKSVKVYYKNEWVYLDGVPTPII